MDSLTKLREAIENVFGHDWRYDTLPVDRYRVRAALAAVEQEMAKLARSEAYLAERVEALEAQQALRAQEMAALEAERDELRKRPTLEEVLRVVTQWDYDNRHALSTWADTEPEDKTLDARMGALYAEKAAQ